MKARDHDKIVSNIEAKYMRALSKERAAGARRLCSYLSDATFSAVCSDLMRNADGGAGALLELLTELKQDRDDRKPTTPDKAHS